MDATEPVPVLPPRRILAGHGAVLVCTMLLLAEPGGPIDLARHRINNFQGTLDPLVLAVHTSFALLAIAVLPVVLVGWRATAKAVLPLLAFAGAATASTLWSAAPTATLDRAVSLFALLVLALWVTRFLPPTKQLRMLALALTARTLLSLSVQAFATIPPEMRILTRGWQGAHVQSNYFGAATALAVVVCSATALTEPQHTMRWTWLGVTLLHVAVLDKAECASAVVACIVGVSVIAATLVRRLVSPHFGTRAVDLTLSGLGGLVAICVWTWHVQFFRALNRSSTFSGRSDIWRAALPAIKERWLAGWGFNTFWQHPSPMSAAIDQRWGQHVLHLHNSFLEILLGLGVMGLVLFGFVLGTALYRLRADADQVASAWRAAVIATLLVHMMTESFFVEPPHIFLAVLAVTTLSGLDAPAARHRKSRFAW